MFIVRNFIKAVLIKLLKHVRPSLVGMTWGSEQVYMKRELLYEGREWLVWNTLATGQQGNNFILENVKLLIKTSAV